LSNKRVFGNLPKQGAAYSHRAIIARKAFTLGVPSDSQVKDADYMDIATGSKVDKFSEVGWTAVKSDLVDAPYAAEIPFVVECKLIKTIELGLHTMFIGEVVDVKAEKQILGENRQPDMKKLNPLAFAPENRKYYSIGNVAEDAFSIGRK